jgi:Tol biopolymer transport system component/DNA-binding winged helix-turn-helix (wHTH) protein
VINFPFMNAPVGLKAKFFRFGPFELDTSLGQLRKHNIPIRLQEQPSKLLLCLLENPGTVVSREELGRRIWAEGTFVDFDHGLNAAVTRLRRALSDSAESPRYIERVAGKGYRFTAPLSEYSPSEPAKQIEIVPSPATFEHRTRLASSRPLQILLGMVASFLLVMVAFFYFRPAADTAIYTTTPLTTYVGSQLCPSFSPDGERVAFSWDGEKRDNFDIYVKQIGVAIPSRLTTDPMPDMSPAWSPDGRTVAFLRFSSGPKAELILMPSLGSGPERKLAEVVASAEAYKRSLRLLSWSSDGKWLIVPDASSVEGPLGLFLISVGTGEKRRLTQTAHYDDLEPAFSPDMKSVAFARYIGTGTSYVHVLALSDNHTPIGEPKPMSFEQGQSCSPVWIAHGQILLFAHSAHTGEPSLWYTTLSKHPGARPLPLAADSATGVALSPQGDRLAYTRKIVNSNIWALEASGAPLWAAQRNASKPWVTSSFEEDTAAFSPDGLRIAVQSSRSGWSEIWIHDRDGSHARQLTDLRGGIAGYPHWSPDGKKIVIHWRPRGDPGDAALYMVEVATGRSRRVTTGPIKEETTPSWSHDGKWIYFSWKQSGAYEVWKVPAEGGAARQMTRNGGWVPSESPDGKNLFYAKKRANGSSLWRIPLDGGAERQEISDVASGGSAYAVGKSGIYYVREATVGASRQIVFYSFESEKMKVLADIAGPVQERLDVSPDEHLLLYPQIDHLASNLMLVENFRLRP